MGDTMAMSGMRSVGTYLADTRIGCTVMVASLAGLRLPLGVTWHKGLPTTRA